MRRLQLLLCLLYVKGCTIKIDEREAQICNNECTNSINLKLHHEKSILKYHKGCYPLTEAALKRSLVNPGRLRELNLEKSVKVLVIGGSVANGFSAGGSPSSKAFVHWLKKEYPKTQISLKSIARDGTDSYWFVSSNTIKNLDKADLVFFDYSTNDLIDNVKYSEMRAIYEKIIRSVNRTPIIMLSLLRTMDSDCSEHDFYFQEHVLEPVASYYNVTLISYKDAIKPTPNSLPSPASLWDTKGVHPLWYVHQLIADTIAYAVNTVRKDGFIQHDDNNTQLPPPIFTLSSIDDLTACPQPLTHYYHTQDNHSLRDAARFDEQQYWSYWTLRKGKEGWQYNATSRRSLRVVQPHTKRIKAPSEAINYVLSSKSILGESIHFEMNFSAAPALVITFLKSYEHFGAAVVAIDGNEKHILNLIQVQNSYRTTCERITNHGLNLNKITHLKYAKHCSQHLAGELDDPWVLNGHWTDHSSQAFVTAFTRSYQAYHDIYLAPQRNQYESYKKNPTKAPLVYVPQSTTTIPFISPPGLHNVSISFLRKRAYPPSSQSRHDDNTADFSTFKIMELKSC
mmetsp:Transcript_22002/g.33958  ORF Transcript_22002/g.33958 Transcript_22002/m.33958 type:complete len:568 (-) Transcript_22002:792-2495(-)